MCRYNDNIYLFLFYGPVLEVNKMYSCRPMGHYIDDLLYNLPIRAYIRKYLHRMGELTVLTRMHVNLKRFESAHIIRVQCI